MHLTLLISKRVSSYLIWSMSWGWSRLMLLNPNVVNFDIEMDAANNLKEIMMEACQGPGIAAVMHG